MKRLAVVLVLAVPTLLPAQRTFTATRELTINGEKENLSEIQSMAVSAKGIIAFGQPQDHQIRFFDAKGVSLGTFGRDGEGPGEFRQMNGAIGWIGDTLWMMQSLQGKIMFVGPDHKLIRTRSFQPQLLPPNGGRGSLNVPSEFGAVPRSMARDGGRLATVLGIRAPAPGWLPLPPGDASPTLVVRTDSNSVFQRIIATLPKLTRVCTTTVGGRPMSIPLCATNSWAIPTDAGIAMIVIPGDVSGGQAHVKLVAMNGVTGDTNFAREYALSPVPITQKVVDSLRKVIDGFELPAEVKAAMRSVEFPKYFPPISSVVVFGSDGTIWLRDLSIFIGNSTKWTILDPKGLVLGTLHTPSNIELLAATKGFFWGTETTADGGENVVRFRVQ